MPYPFRWQFRGYRSHIRWQRALGKYRNLASKRIKRLEMPLLWVEKGGLQ